MDEFELEVKGIFLEEAVQIVSDLERCFLALESDPKGIATLDELFRLAHNLKGSSKAVGFDALGAYVHEFESALLNVFKSAVGPGAGAQEAISFFLGALDSVAKMIDTLRANLAAEINTAPALASLEEFNQRWARGEVASGHQQEAMDNEPSYSDDHNSQDSSSQYMGGQLDVPSSDDFDETDFAPAQESAQKSKPEQWSIVTTQHEASVAAKVAVNVHQDRDTARQPKASGGSNSIPGRKAGSDESIRVSLERLENLINYVGEIVILHTVLEDQVERGNFTGIKKMLSQLGKVTKDVQDLSMGLRMVPLKNNFQKMQRIVRDTGRSLGKDVQLEMEGEETELDKTVLDALNDPLTHLVRNAVDHGIESPDERASRGKPRRGTVRLAAFHRSGKMVIEIVDDGGGINIEKLHEKAYAKGILKPGARLSDAEARELIFHAGFSTKDSVSEVSGRGVGMDVVRTNIEALQGEVQVESELGKGSCFRIILPLTLAIIDGMIVKSGTERFVVPLSHVHESVNPTAEDIKFNSGMGELLILREENIPLYRMSQLLGQKPESTMPMGTAIVIRTQAKVFAVMVDDIIGQHQVVIKKLGKELGTISGYLGSAILGDGKPSLILELPELVEKFGQRTISNFKQGRVAV